jgi:hypothetical protein
MPTATPSLLLLPTSTLCGLPQIPALISTMPLIRTHTPMQTLPHRPPSREGF